MMQLAQAVIAALDLSQGCPVSQLQQLPRLLDGLPLLAIHACAAPFFFQDFSVPCNKRPMF